MKHFISLLVLILSLGFAAAQEKFVILSERQVPIAYEVDILFVGGSTGNVAAAIETQKAGAKTMLITDRPYLGDDIAATLRLWLEPGEKLDDPLAAAIFNDPDRGQPMPSILSMLGAQKKIAFTYTVAEKIDPAHADTPQKNRLFDGVSANPVTQSLQINGDATITVDLKKTQPVGVLSLFGFYRVNDFVIASVTVSASDDGTTWKEIGNAKKTAESRDATDAPIEFRLVLDNPTTTRYLKLNVKKTEAAKRVLLGEIIVLPDKNLIPEPQARPKANEKYPHPAPRPMHVKQTLDKALEEAGVKFLYSTYCTGTLIDATGRPAVRGVVINNRAGRQVILAKSVITVNDEIESTLVGSAVARKTSGIAEFVVIGGTPKEIDAAKYPLLKNASYEIIGEPFYGPAKTQSGEFPIIRYTFPIEGDTAIKCFAHDLKTVNELEKQIRLATYDPDQQFTADKIIFRAKDVKYLTIPRLIAEGRKIGIGAAKEAAEVGKIDSAALQVSNGTFFVQRPDTKEPEPIPGEIKESLSNVKAFKEPLGFVKQSEQKIPVAGEYDVVIVGGGTSGAPAGIATGRQGAKTLVLEYLHDLGGTGTAGAISIYYHGNRVGFTAEVEDGKSSWIIEQRINWWRSKLAEAGTEVWYGVLGSGVVAETKNGVPTVTGVLVTTPQGPRIVLAKVVIDATGNGDIAETAGAKTNYVDGYEIAVQGHGLPPRDLGASYTNTDYMYVDETDVEDTTHVFVYGKEKFPKAFDFGKIMDTRERKRIVGDFSFDPLDQINKRTYPDTIFRSYSDFDTHGYTTTPYFEISHLHHDRQYADVPYRSSLPQGLEGILVSGLATSCHRDAIPLIRMQPDLQNQGYALGCIAAKAAKEGVPLRKLDIKPVQKHLVEIGSLPERVLTDKDNYGEAVKNLSEAIKTVPDEFRGAELLLWYPKESLPLLKDAYAQAEDKDKISFAILLASLGDSTGSDSLIAAVQSFDQWDAGWNFRGMGQYGWASSPLDRYIMMLGRTKDRRGVVPICEKLSILKAEDDFSHHRACALALEWIGDETAASAIAEILRKPGVMGYVHHDLDTARKWDKADPKGSTAEKSRRDSLIEIGYARALYRLGDYEGLGKRILEEYKTDLRGYFSRHANEVLKEKEEDTR